VLSDHKLGAAGFVAALILALPLYLLHHSLQQEELAVSEQRLQQRAALSFNNAQSNLKALQEHLLSLSSLLRLKPDLSRDAFDRFNSQTSISAYGIAAFEWIPRIERSAAAQWVARARQDGIFDFRLIDTRKPASTLFPIYYTSASQMNGLSLGRNLAAHPDLWPVMQQAATSNSLQVGVSENTQLDETEGAEFRLLLPVFSTSENQLQGFVSAMFRFEEAMHVLLGSILSSNNGLGLQIHDDASGELLFGSSQQTRALIRSGNARATFPLALGDRQLTFTFIDRSEPLPWWHLPRSALMTGGIALVALSMLLLMQRTLARRHRAEALAQQQTRSLKAVQSDYHNLFEKVIEGVYSATLDGRFVRVNPALARAFGYDSPEQMLAEVDQIGEQLHTDLQRYHHFLSQLHSRKEVLNYEWEGRDRQGNPVWLSENAYLNYSEDGTPIYQGTIDVITERKLNEQQLSYQARHDALTGLLNRSAFQQALDRGLQQHNRGAVLFIDIDGFKKINDTLGHAIGDLFLCELAERLRNSTRSEDCLARIGGDEFVIYSQGSGTEQQTIRLAERLQSTICELFWLPELNQPLQVSASIGIRFINEQTPSAGDVLRDADLAMYEVKKNGKGTHHIFSVELHERMTRQNQLESLLEQALARDEFSLHYQPVVGIHSQQIMGFEALLRWRNNELGWVPPARFIPVAEQSSLIQQLGLWVIRQGFQGLSRIQQQTGQYGLTLNINLSPRQLQDDLLLSKLPGLLQTYQLDAGQINFEVTESALNTDEEDPVIERLTALRELGFGIYIDDFGTGYSSLKRLIDFPATGLKIDRSFVDGIDQDQNKQVMVEMVMSMSRLLDLNIVAEGIETVAEQQVLINQGCRRAQGYLFCQPMPEAALTAKMIQPPEDDMDGMSLLPA